MRNLICVSLFTFFISSCENRALHDSSEFRPREIHEQIEFHFDKIEVDGVEYLILEKDNNNPHEGFGFMAFRANRIMEKQDSVIAYMKTISEMQSLIYAKVYNVDNDVANEVNREILQRNIDLELQEIQNLEEDVLSTTTRDSTSVKK